MKGRTPMTRGTSMLKRTAWKRSAPKKRAGHDKSYLQACRGELCFIRIPGVCIGGMDTTVPAHSNQSRHGKGMGIKADDRFTVPACYACHAEIDQGSHFTREEKFALWNAAYERWEPVREQKLCAKPAAITAGKQMAASSVL